MWETVFYTSLIFALINGGIYGGIKLIQKGFDAGVEKACKEKEAIPREGKPKVKKPVLEEKTLLYNAFTGEWTWKKDK